MSRRLEIRGRDLVGRSGVGAIVEIGRQSFVTTDLKHWGGGRYDGQTITLPRLSRRIGIPEFRTTQGTGQPGRPGPAFVRFPAWMFCERCGALRRYPPGAFGREQPTCRSCGPSSYLIGIRWVGACKQGHLFDVPWDRWAHLNHLGRKFEDPNCRAPHGLRYRAQRGRGGESSIVISCRDCGRASSLTGLTGTGTLAAVELETCPGTQPWQDGAHAEKCDEVPTVMMRASSRLYFPRSTTALDIPPDADRKPETDVQDRIRQKLDPITRGLWLKKHQRGEAIADIELFAEALDCGPSDILGFLDKELGIEAPGAGSAGSLEAAADPASEQSSLHDEWLQLMRRRSDSPSWSRFVTEHVDTAELGPELAGLFDAVVLVRRLRVVRAFTGYKRMDGASEIPPTSRTPSGKLAVDWLPAHEVIGEGVFLNLSQTALSSWEARQQDREMAERRDVVTKRLSGSIFVGGAQRHTHLGPHFVLLHTLSHLLLREMAYSAGYSAASIRERIYHGSVGSRQSSGILLYTADGDSEGTLGGLVRLGEPDRLRRSFLGLAARATWCGQDPVCRESSGQGLFALNLAACHGCALTSETSCAHANVLLDRNRLFGIRDGAPGFLDGLRGG